MEGAGRGRGRTASYLHARGRRKPGEHVSHTAIAVMQEEECPAAEVVVGLNEVSGTCARCHLSKVKRRWREEGVAGGGVWGKSSIIMRRGGEEGEGAGEGAQNPFVNHFMCRAAIISDSAPLPVTLSLRSAAGRRFRARGKLLLFLLPLTLLSMSHGPLAGHLT